MKRAARPFSPAPDPSSHWPSTPKRTLQPQTPAGAPLGQRSLERVRTQPEARWGDRPAGVAGLQAALRGRAKGPGAWPHRRGRPASLPSSPRLRWQPWEEVIRPLRPEGNLG